MKFQILTENRKIRSWHVCIPFKKVTEISKWKQKSFLHSTVPAGLGFLAVFTAAMNMYSLFGSCTLGWYFWKKKREREKHGLSPIFPMFTPVVCIKSFWIYAKQKNKRIKSSKKSFLLNFLIFTILLFPPIELDCGANPILFLFLFLLSISNLADTHAIWSIYWERHIHIICTMALGFYSVKC